MPAEQDVVNKILIVGGTHGNESTGVFLINKWLRRPELLRREGLKVDILIGNPQAVKANRRYLDKDLNRCFSEKVLKDDSLSGIEIQRAHQLVEQLGPKGKCNYDLIIDLHTTTANMGVNLVLTLHDTFHHKMMAYMKKQRDDVVVTSEAELIPDHHFLCALANKNLIVEVGPVAQGLLNHQVIEKTEQATYQLLDFVELWNKDAVKNLPPSIEVFEYTGKVKYPVDKNGNIVACIHESIQNKDFISIKEGDVVFRNIMDGDIPYTGSPTYISFINEAAYYDQNIAFCTLKKSTIKIPG
ncbi:aspartoacylase [Pleionea sediminis]|uniref:aspartoacylase n=1 Tax=Pleionea sediminis TaxID=2569479 RepID=UPI001186D167|nr:aspartoacylase [Pleionea sediminis]